jgi:hypothetical protein
VKLQATPETKALLGGPIHLSKTFWSQLLAAATGLPSLLSMLHAIKGLALPVWLEHAMLITAACAMWASTFFARDSGINAAGVVADGTLPPVVDPPA